MIALIFLVLMSLFAISAFNSSSVNMRVVGNTEARQESAAAVQVAIEETISSTGFYTNPAGVESESVRVDTTGDGLVDYSVKMTPAPHCFRAKPISQTQLPPAPKRGSDAYTPCRKTPGGGGSAFEEHEAPTSEVDPESCVDTEWNVRAEVADAATKSSVSANQGVAVVVFGNQVSSYCK